MKIFITGIAGFLGSHIAQTALQEGHSVSGCDNMLCGSEANIVATGVPVESIYQIDCNDYSSLAARLRRSKPDVLVHCAATAHEGLSNFSPAFVTENIFGASVATFSAAIEAGVKRIVYMSSMARYGHGMLARSKHTNGEFHDRVFCDPPFKEDVHTTAPIDPYGIAKVAVEDVLKNLCTTHNVKWTILVPHNIIGVRQRSIDPFRNVAAIMINRCKQGLPPIIYGSGLHKRCFSPVKDCLPSIMLAIEGAVDAEVVNIGPDTGTMTIAELARTICNLTGMNSVTHVDDRPNEVAEAYTCSDKARRLLNFEPKQPVIECLKEMVAYIKPEPFLYNFPIEINSPKCPKTWTEKLI